MEDATLRVQWLGVGALVLNIFVTRKMSLNESIDVYKCCVTSKRKMVLRGLLLLALDGYAGMKQCGGEYEKTH